MSREIKFRFWCKMTNCYSKPQNGCMVGADGEWYANDEMGIVIKLFKEHYVVEQYAGLKDKNGKEIYEGDILWEEPKCVHQRERPRRHSVVVWHNNGWRRSCYNGKYEVHPELCVRELKVIGNIHENPELLEGIE